MFRVQRVNRVFSAKFLQIQIKIVRMDRIIVFFDGVCGLCNWSVDYLIRHDRQKKFLYSPLQGHEIKKYNMEVNLEFPASLMVWDGRKMLLRSEAWLFLMFELGGWRKGFSALLSVIPVTVLNIVYDLVAQNRYRLFGKNSQCRIPSPDERSLFLD